MVSPKMIRTAATAIAVMLLASSCSNAATNGSTGEPAGAAANKPAAEANAQPAADQVQEGTASAEQAVDEQPDDRLFWKPKVGWVGDIMPFSDGKELHLFYLQDWRDGAPGFHPWHQVTTTNTIDYADQGEAIPFAGEADPDLAIGTGSVIKAGDTYHAYYTGHNYKFPDQGKPKEAMMHAVSKDLLKWTKVPADTFNAPEGYEKNDFRDPLLLHDAKSGEYWMLVAARKDGKGVIAKFVSKDLSHWEVREPLDIEAAGTFFMLECPDVFELNGKWYLVFSEFSDKKSTHYRVSDSMNGPWKLPAGSDVFDGRAFYAAKTGELNGQRYLYGWVPTRQLEKDYMKWDWAGNMVAHKLISHSDGTLGVAIPDAVGQLLGKEQPLDAWKPVGSAAENGGVFTLDGASGLAGTVFGHLPEAAKITGKLRFDEKVAYTGLATGIGDEVEKAYGIQLEPAKSRIRYDAAKGDTLSSLEPDVQVPLTLEAGVDYPFTIVIEDDVAVFYIQDHALTTRVYKMKQQPWGWYSRGGTTTLSELKLFVPAS